MSQPHRPCHRSPLAKTLIGVALMLGAAAGQAALVGVTSGYPLLSADNLRADWGGGDNNFQVLENSNPANTAFTFTDVDGGTPVTITADFLDIQVTFQAGSPGAFSSGVVLIQNFGSLVFSANLLDFGYEFTSGTPNSTGTFDANLTITAVGDPLLNFQVGEAAVFRGTFTDLNANITSGDNWPTAAFASQGDGTGVADFSSASVPLPSSLSLMALGLFAAGCLRRRLVRR